MRPARPARLARPARKRRRSYKLHIGCIGGGQGAGGVTGYIVAALVEDWRRLAAAPVEDRSRRTLREPAAGVMDRRRSGQRSDSESRSLRTAGLGQPAGPRHSPAPTGVRRGTSDGQPVTMDDCMITFDTPTASLRQATYGFRQAMLLDTTPVLRTNHHPNSSSEQMPCSREGGEMGTQVIQNRLLARTTDT